MRYAVRQRSAASEGSELARPSWSFLLGYGCPAGASLVRVHLLRFGSRRWKGHVSILVPAFFHPLSAEAHSRPDQVRPRSLELP